MKPTQYMLGLHTKSLEYVPYQYKIKEMSESFVTDIFKISVNKVERSATRLNCGYVT